MDPVEMLTAIEDIRTLKARYFRCVDTKAWREFRTLFTDDAILDFPENDFNACPIDTFIGLAEEFLAGVCSIHHGHTPEIVIEDTTRARAIWPMDDSLYFPADPPRSHNMAHVRGYGHYHETYVRDDGVWRIRTLRLSRLRLERVLNPQAVA
ncbi:nuclear transport factor 2 family protein [Sphingobium sp. JS3065]|jgi:hypothetical protein|uniref:nuclear transport factor 2 family protein n=1 Tax=Sphingobium sp. JS3065 TaxID=2970925 RepID=UPI002264455C|nr:nuclear transport factor 2 family protein [Sphingobium sp. JS3065]UZW57233.1 nuclear transport factor 2 family protein [Sphingobium sp. JS3065]